MNDLFDDIFEDLFTGEPCELESSKDALSAVALGAAASDGAVSSEERLRFVALALGNPLFSNDTEQIITEASKMIHYVTKLGPAHSLKMASKVLSKPLKETAFSWAVDIVVSDGWLDEAERSYLELIITEFDIDHEMAKKIVEVIKIRNRTQ